MSQSPQVDNQNGLDTWFVSVYEQLRGLYDSGEQQRLPTLLRRLKELEIKLDIPPDQRIPD